MITPDALQLTMQVPPDCQREDLPTLGERCMPCPVEQGVDSSTQAAACGFLAVGKRLKSVVQACDEANSNLNIAIWDPLLGRVLSPGGLEVELRRSASLQAVVRRNNFGIIRWDVRGLSGPNEVDHEIGNGFLQLAAFYLERAMRSGVSQEVYTGPERREKARGPETPSHKDVFYYFWRPGGDEGGVILPDTSPEGLMAATERIVGKFSVRNALDNPDRVPIIIGAGSAHSTRLRFGPQDLEQGEDVRNYFMAVNKVADKSERLYSGRQYRDIADAVWAREDPAKRGPFPMPIATKMQKRAVAARFFDLCCPEFTNNMEAMIQDEVLAMEAMLYPAIQNSNEE